MRVCTREILRKIGCITAGSRLTVSETGGDSPVTNVGAPLLFRSDSVPMGGHHVVYMEVGRLLRRVAGTATSSDAAML